MARSNAHNARINRNATASVENTSGNSELTDVPPRAHVLPDQHCFPLPPFPSSSYRIPSYSASRDRGYDYEFSISLSLLRARIEKKIFEEELTILLLIVENYWGTSRNRFSAVIVQTRSTQSERVFAKLRLRSETETKGSFLFLFFTVSWVVFSRNLSIGVVRMRAIHETKLYTRFKKLAALSVGDFLGK